MKWKKARKKPLYVQNEAQDSLDLTKSAFELFFVILMLFFVLVFIFTVCFRIVTFEKKNNGKLRTYSFVSSHGVETFQKGQIVSVDSGVKVTAGEIVALEGETIRIGRDGENAVNCVTYQDKRYFSNEELEEALPGLTVPKGYVLLDGDITRSEELRVGEMVRQEYVIGEARFRIYPFSLFGKEPDAIRNV